MTRRSLLAAEEWDFSALPENQHRACLTYEYGRFSDHECAAVARLRRRVTDEPTFAAYIDRIRGEANHFREFSTWTRTHDLAFLFPEFPDTPWLKIASATRMQRLTDGALSTEPDQLFVYQLGDGGIPCIEGHSVILNPWISRSQARQLFEQLLAEHASPTKGGRVDRPIDGLNALAAFRLLEAAKKVPDAAREFSTSPERAVEEMSWGGRPAFNDGDSLRKAAYRATEIRNMLYPAG